MEFLRDAVNKSGDAMSANRSGNNRRLRVVDELKFEYTQTAVVETPKSTLYRNRVVAGRERDEFADAYRMLRSRVMHKLNAGGWTSVGVTSTGPGQGKSLTSANLAVSIAQKVNNSALLVDFDLRRPSIRKLFDYRGPMGLQHYISKQVPLDEVLFNPGIDRLVVLPGGKPNNRSSELLASHKVVELTREVIARYPSRIVIFDLPPVLATDDALTILPHLDSCLLVVEEGHAKRNEVRRAIELLDEFNLIGTVLNKSRDKHSAYSYKTKYY